MSKDEALKLALEALELHGQQYPHMVKGYCLDAITAIREALAEQETVLPGGGHVPAVPVAVYGYCPECGGAGVMRERRPNGDDKCTNGHKYPSSKALAEQPAQQQEPVAIALNTGTKQGVKWLKNVEHGERLYTSPPASKPWVGLTDAERDDIWERHHTTLGGWDYGGDDVMYDRHFEPAVADIEAKLREKNA